MSFSGKKPAHKSLYLKPPITFAEQVQKLQKRNLEVPDTAKAEFYLGRINYYRFTAYCLPFERDHTSHRFTDGVSFDDILNLYIFDRELRLLVMDAIERIEVSLRTQFAYHLSHNHQTAHPHLKSGIFSDSVIYANSLHNLEKDIKRSKEDFIRHLVDKYSDSLPPVWAVVELLTMGQLSKWFGNIKYRHDRQSISRIYGLDEKVMASFCEHLSLVRNHAAHHARLWNRDFTKTPMLPRKADAQLVSSLVVKPEYDRQLRKLYNTFVILAYLMEKICGENHWQDRLVKLINAHRIDVRKMGFPDDWRQRSIWQGVSGEYSGS